MHIDFKLNLTGLICSGLNHVIYSERAYLFCRFRKNSGYFTKYECRRYWICKK